MEAEKNHQILYKTVDIQTGLHELTSLVTCSVNTVMPKNQITHDSL